MGRSKYHAVKVKTADGVFDSGREYERWCELKLLQRAGKIRSLQRQVRYELIPKQYIRGKLAERAVLYYADFVYEQAGQSVVEDVKGVRTPEYIIKRKLMLWVHGIRIREV